MRLCSSIVRDPLFWVFLAATLLAALRWLNGGVALGYDVELRHWAVREPSCVLLPGSATGKGYLPFAACLACWVLLMGCRHALGKKARFFFLAAGAFFAACSAVTLLCVNAWSGKTFPAPNAVAYGLFCLGGLVALIGGFELHWRKSLLLIAFSMTGASAGLCLFAPPAIALLFLAVFVLLICLGCAYLALRVNQIVPFKFMALLLISLTLPVLCVMSFASADFYAHYVGLTTEGQPLFSSSFLELRALLSNMAQKIWVDHPWLGAGEGSFHLHIRFLATPFDWDIIPPGQKETLNGWWQLLAERGIIGTFSYAAVAITLLALFIQRLVLARGRSAFLPLSVLGPLALVLAAAVMFINLSFLQPEVTLATGALLALAISSFPSGDTTHGR